MAWVYLLAHGGHCCGIRHLEHGEENLTSTHPVVQAKQSIPVGKIPAMTSRERVEVLINSNYVPYKSLVEIALITSQAKKWRPALEEIGFKEVSTFVNSNSDNTVHVFHFRKNQKD